MWLRNGLDVEWDGKSGSDVGNGMVAVLLIPMRVMSHPMRERDLARNGSNEMCKDTNFVSSRRDVNCTGNVTSDLGHSIFQFATLARKVA